MKVKLPKKECYDNNKVSTNTQSTLQVLMEDFFMAHVAAVTIAGVPGEKP